MSANRIVEKLTIAQKTRKLPTCYALCVRLSCSVPSVGVSPEPSTQVNTVTFVNVMTKIIINVCNPGLRRSSYEDVRETALLYLTFRGPCIVIYSYNKTNEMH